MKGRLTITEVADSLGVTPRTIMRWEKSGKVKKPKRDWRGWRFYQKEDLDDIRRFYESSYEYDQLERPVANNAKDVLISIIAISSLALTYIIGISATCYADQGIKETSKSVDIVLDELPAVNTPTGAVAEGVKYTLGPNDVISIEVRRHPEFSGKYTINSEGKIEYKYLGDIKVDGLTKAELKKWLEDHLMNYLKFPEVDIQILAYMSKVFYVVGDVAHPGKFYMRGDTVTIREALVQSGLPTHAAAMRRCRLITPNKSGKNNYKNVNVYALLYSGDLGENLEMNPGEVLYVPATVMAKIIRVVQPVTNAVAETAGKAASGAAVAAAAL